MWIRVLRAAARRPLLAAFLTLTAVITTIIAAIAWVACDPSPCAVERTALVASANDRPEFPDLAPEGDVAPRLILNRVWFDKLPEKPTDSLDLWIFLGGGIAFHETGSQFRYAVEIAELERTRNKLELVFFQDKRKVRTTFAIETCDDNPPFNLCLTLKDMPGGPVKLFAFAYDDELERAAPWAKVELESAKARAKTIISAQP